VTCCPFTNISENSFITKLNLSPAKNAALLFSLDPVINYRIRGLSSYESAAPQSHETSPSEESIITSHAKALNIPHPEMPTAVICPNCQGKSSAIAKFCRHCGAKLE